MKRKQIKISLAVLILSFTFVFSGIAQNQSYQVGEKLKYLMYYGWIDGGHASLQLNKDTLNGDTLNHVKLHAKSIGLTDRLYSVSDVYESYFDPETGLPQLAIRNISEGKYKLYNEVDFYHDSSYVMSQKSGKVEIPPQCYDILSSFYHLRNIITNTDLKPDSVIRLNSYFSDEDFPLILRYKGKERIKTKLGKINCLKFMPVTEVGRVFKTEDDMEIWFSDDANALPIRVRFDLFIGALKCDLVEYSGLVNDIKY